MQEFHPSRIRQLVFELDSLTANFDQDAWDNFRQFLKIIDDRDFATILIADSIQASEWSSYEKLSVIKSTGEEAFNNNSSLSGADVFWFSEQASLQTKLSSANANFAGSTRETTENGGLQYQHLYDTLQIFNPSKITTTDLSTTLFKLKQDSEQVPLMLGIGGPDECGHSFFVGELFDALEDRELLVSSLDLSKVLGTEFQKHDKSDLESSSSLWRSIEIRDWLIDDVLSPYNQGKQVYIENPPENIKDYDICTFPLFLAPEMILLVWGTTIFLPEFEKLIDLRFLLELSEKTAAARMFALDERENFDKSFIETYHKQEGKYYKEYLEKFEVQKQLDYRINFDNFNAFSIKQ
jgi:uridine kinase